MNLGQTVKVSLIPLRFDVKDDKVSKKAFTSGASDVQATVIRANPLRHGVVDK